MFFPLRSFYLYPRAHTHQHKHARSRVNGIDIWVNTRAHTPNVHNAIFSFTHRNHTIAGSHSRIDTPARNIQTHIGRHNRYVLYYVICVRCVLAYKTKFVSYDTVSNAMLFFRNVGIHDILSRKLNERGCRKFSRMHWTSKRQKSICLILDWNDRVYLTHGIDALTLV